MGIWDVSNINERILYCSDCNTRICIDARIAQRGSVKKAAKLWKEDHNEGMCMMPHIEQQPLFKKNNDSQI